MEIDSTTYRKGCWWPDGFRRVFTDGACIDPSDDRLARAGFGVYGGPNCPENKSRKLEGYLQCPYRAELRAVVDACCESDTPTWVILDNEVVATHAAALLEGHNAQRPSKCLKLWDCLENRCGEQPIGTYRVTWMKGHILGEHNEYIEKGMATQKEAEWHHLAGMCADAGAELHRVPHIIAAAAAYRKVLAMLAHNMMFEIWESV